jgi:hypothetical protein
LQIPPDAWLAWALVCAVAHWLIKKSTDEVSAAYILSLLSVGFDGGILSPGFSRKKIQSEFFDGSIE